MKKTFKKTRRKNASLRQNRGSAKLNNPDPFRHDNDAVLHLCFLQHRGNCFEIVYLNFGRLLFWRSIASGGYNSADCGDCRECYRHFSGISLFYLSKSKTRRIAGKRWLRKKQSKVVGERFAISKPRMSPGARQLFFCMDYPRTTRLG